jgi:hypothetical protein
MLILRHRIGIVLIIMNDQQKTDTSCAFSHYSNPPVQELALQYGSLSLLCRLLSLSEADVVQKRALFALSALLRGNAKEQVKFIKNYQGIYVLGKSFGKRSLQVQVKSVVLLTDILNDEV